MKKMLVILILVLAIPTFAAAAAVTTYQVTGPVLEVTDSKIVVQKGKDRWELARDKDTNVSGDLKVGNKVTIEYHMVATKVEVKEAKKAAEAKKPAAAKEEKKPAAPAPK
jgi:hypothetical protein